MERKVVVELSFDGRSVLGENDRGIDLAVGDRVVLFADDGYGVATVVSGEKILERADRRTHRIVRKVTPQDVQRLEENTTRAADARSFIEQKILEHDLPMRVVSVRYSFDRSRLYVYYAADGHVDFRGLVRDLAQRFQTRIQMEQVGPRDETRIMGGVGVCGLILCCHQWLPKLESISVGMAKTQQLSLNIPKLSGLCNKLKCCLAFEYDFYKECVRCMPNPGSRVTCADGEGKVLSLDCLKGTVTVAVNRGEAGTVIRSYAVTDVQQVPGTEKQKQQKQAAERDRHAPAVDTCSDSGPAHHPQQRDARLNPRGMRRDDVDAQQQQQQQTSCGRSCTHGHRGMAAGRPGNPHDRQQDRHRQPAACTRENAAGAAKIDGDTVKDAREPTLRSENSADGGGGTVRRTPGGAVSEEGYRHGKLGTAENSAAKR